MRGFHYSGSCLTKMHMGYQFSVEFNAEMKNEDNFDLIFLIHSKKSKNVFLVILTLRCAFWQALQMFFLQSLQCQWAALLSLKAVHLILKVTSPWKISVIFFWFELFFTFKDKISFSTRFKASKTSDEEPATSRLFLTL